MDLTDPLLENGYQIKTRWVAPDHGSATLWQWANFFPFLAKAKEYKDKHEGEIEPVCGWKLEIKIFHIELLEYE